MPTLSDAFNGDAAKSAAVVDDCCTLIDEEVAGRGGISGLALKAGYGIVKGIKPGFVKHVVTDLLPVECPSFDDIITVVAEGYRNRRIGSTALNKESSRSHRCVVVCGCVCLCVLV